MRKLKLVIQYQGTKYHGWQVQPRALTIQKLFQDILQNILGEKVVVTASGRTDAGVHALAQVAHFSTSHPIETEVLHRALNAHLPYDIAVLSVEEVDLGFDAQFGAKAKTYTYFIYNGFHKAPFLSSYSWRIYGTLDLDAMQLCLEMLLGEQDFSSFKAADSTAKTSRRRLDAVSLQRVSLADLGNSLMGLMGISGLVAPLGTADTFHPEAESETALIAISMRGKGFLKHMVRNIVGTLVEVGRGRMSVEAFARVFAARDRTQAGPTAPAWGLFLVKVDY